MIVSKAIVFRPSSQIRKTGLSESSSSQTSTCISKFYHVKEERAQCQQSKCHVLLPVVSEWGNCGTPPFQVSSFPWFGTAAIAVRPLSKCPSFKLYFGASDTFSFCFFFLHCRASARHGRSTTGILSRIEFKFPWKQETNNTHKQNTNNQNPHTSQSTRQRNPAREIRKTK